LLVQMSPLTTTTIGSLSRFDPDLHKSIDRALAFQREHRLGVLTDGEQRTDMISYFAESFEGLAVENGSPVVVGPISLRGPPEDFSKVKDLEFIRSKHPDLKIKVALTGPTTLGMTCASKKIKSHYKNIMDFDLYEDIAIALAPLAKALVDRGSLVQIDEPFLSSGHRDIEARVDLLDYLANGLPKEKMSVHVCGFIGQPRLVDDLLQLENYSVLSFGFAGRVEAPNIEHIAKDFKAHGKKLGAGCIKVTPVSEKDVDPPQEVSQRLERIASKVGRENIAYAHPDCGMRATDKSLVPLILKNMRAGVDIFG
jgi:methionine synthase II (cobalamin-independent)